MWGRWWFLFEGWLVHVLLRLLVSCGAHSPVPLKHPSQEFKDGAALEENDNGAVRRGTDKLGELSFLLRVYVYMCDHVQRLTLSIEMP